MSIPTLYRPEKGTEYLLGTLTSLFTQMTAAEKASKAIIIVVTILDPDMNHRAKVTSRKETPRSAAASLSHGRLRTSYSGTKDS